VEAITKKPFMRSQRASSVSEQNKSALTDQKVTMELTTTT